MHACVNSVENILLKQVYLIDQIDLQSESIESIDRTVFGSLLIRYLCNLHSTKAYFSAAHILLHVYMHQYVGMCLHDIYTRLKYTIKGSLYEFTDHN